MADGNGMREHISKSEDPTENVKALMAQSITRLDDLRIAQEALIESRLTALANVMTLRAEHAKEIRDLETKRLDAIRDVDTQAVAVASQRATDQAAVLANQVATSAEALRLLVASTNATINTRLTVVEQAQYTGAGKGEGAKNLWALIVGAVFLAIAAASYLAK